MVSSRNYIRLRRLHSKPFGLNKNRQVSCRNLSIFYGADEGICAFSGAPRSDVINVVLCHQVYRYLNFARQSVLLPQNGSYPQIPSCIRIHTNEKMHPTRCIFSLVRTKGFEPTRCYPQEPETCASANFATSAFYRNETALFNRFHFRLL